MSASHHRDKIPEDGDLKEERLTVSEASVESLGPAVCGHMVRHGRSSCSGDLSTAWGQEEKGERQRGLGPKVAIQDTAPVA